MEKLNIVNIREGSRRRVYDLTVTDNHNFCITRQNILTHNCDYMTPNAQAVLRGTMESYASTVRFLLTCNYPNRVIPAIHSRCQGFHINHLDVDAFTMRMATILVSENVELDVDTLDTYVKATYPDLRKCINSCQMNSQTGSLAPPSDGDTDSSEWMTGVVDLFKQGKIKEGRVLVCANIRLDEYEEMFRFLYRNLELWSDDEDKQNEAILIIRDGLVKHAMVADPEINLSATLVSLEMLR